MLPAIGTVIVLLLIGYGLIGDFFDRGFSLPVSHEGVAEAIERARESAQAAELLGDFAVDRVQMSRKIEGPFELDLGGTVHLVGSRGKGRLSFDYLRRPESRNLAARLTVGDRTIEL